MIVTFSNEYGSSGVAIAERAAAELGYEFVDRQLPVVVAKRLRISPAEVEANEDTTRTIGERLLSSLELATPELAVASTAEPFDEELLRAVQEAVREYARRGNVVIVGRGASSILGARPGVLRVFVHAPRQWRIDRIAGTSHVDAKAAAAEVERMDRARAAYVHAWYGLTYGDPHNYDLCLDASRLGIEGAAATIVATVRAAGS